MTDHAVVTKKTLAQVLEEWSSESADADVLQQLTLREPVLAAYLSERAVAVSGKLALAGAPPEVVRACYAHLLETVGVAVRAIWKAHDEFWRDIDLSGLTNGRKRRVRRRPNPGAEGFSSPLPLDHEGRQSASDSGAA